VARPTAREQCYDFLFAARGSMPTKSRRSASKKKATTKGPSKGAKAGRRAATTNKDPIAADKADDIRTLSRIYA
jgi:hypothetical protein